MPGRLNNSTFAERMEHAGQFARRLEVAFVHRNWPLAHRIVESVRRDIERSEAPLSRQDARKLTLAEAGFQVRTITVLEQMGLRTLGDVERADREKISSAPQIGPSTMGEIEAVLCEFGLYGERKNVS